MNIKKDINPDQLEPIFHSEISSSLLIGTILKTYPDICMAFISHFLNIKPDKIIKVCNEYTYAGVGSIDIYIEFSFENIQHNILIEVKVHDNISTTPGQLVKYFTEAKNRSKDKKLFLLFLTQFNSKLVNSYDNLPNPSSIIEYQDTCNHFPLDKSNFCHISWPDLYKFLKKHKSKFSTTYLILYIFQKKWMLFSIQEHISKSLQEIGDRTLNDVFGLPEEVIRDKLFWIKNTPPTKNKKSTYFIDISKLNFEQHNSLFSLIEMMINAKKVNKRIETKRQWKSENPNEDNTVETFLNSLSKDKETLGLLSFYSRLFHIAESNNHVELYGKGIQSLSLRVRVNNKPISICTIRLKKNILEISSLR